ncbi:MAG: amidohydrolase [Chloroflexi bacterium]|nr:amidohydrolase [Chloroflexota bacterium]MBV9892774.1 amidohydrolase [Chloroflexota bacterium]
MVVVDAHSHFTPRAVIEQLQRSPQSFPHIGLRDLGEGRFAFDFPDIPTTRPMAPRLWDIAAAHSYLDEQGIDVHVVGPWADIFGYTLPAAEATSWATFVNEAVLEALQGQARFVPLATVPLQSGPAAATVLEAAHAMGYGGFTIGTFAPGIDLDDSDLEPLWTSAESLRMPIVLHPLYLYGQPRLAKYDLPNAIGRLNDSAIAVSRLLYGGVLTAHPALQVMVAHGGGGVPYAIGRLARNFELHRDEFADPRAGFERLYFDTVVYDPAPLRYLVEVAGSDHVLLGSDYPFPVMDPRPQQVVKMAGFDEQTVEKIVGGNAQKLFNLT